MCARTRVSREPGTHTIRGILWYRMKYSRCSGISLRVSTPPMSFGLVNYVFVPHILPQSPRAPPVIFVAGTKPQLSGVASLSSTKYHMLTRHQIYVTFHGCLLLSCISIIVYSDYLRKMLRDIASPIATGTHLLVKFGQEPARVHCDVGSCGGTRAQGHRKFWYKAQLRIFFIWSRKIQVKILPW